MNRCPVLIAFVSSILLLAAPVSPAQGAVAGLSSNVPEHNIRNAKHLVRFGQSWESMADAWEQESVPPALTKSMSDDLQALGAPGEVTQAMAALALAAGKPLATRGARPHDLLDTSNRWIGKDPWSKFYYQTGQVNYWAKILSRAMTSPSAQGSSDLTHVGPPIVGLIKQQIDICRSAGDRQCSFRVLNDLQEMKAILEKEPTRQAGRRLLDFEYDVESVYRVQESMTASDRRAEQADLNSEWRVMSFLRMGLYISLLQRSWGSENAKADVSSLGNELSKFDLSPQLTNAANRVYAMSAAPSQMGDIEASPYTELTSGIDKLAGNDYQMFVAMGMFQGQLGSCLAAFELTSPSGKRFLDACYEVLPDAAQGMLIICTQKAAIGGSQCNPTAMDALTGIKAEFAESNRADAKTSARLLMRAEDLSSSFADQ